MLVVHMGLGFGQSGEVWGWYGSSGRAIGQPVTDRLPELRHVNPVAGLATDQAERVAGAVFWRLVRSLFKAVT